MKINFVNDISNIKNNCLILWTDYNLNKFDKNFHSYIKQEDEFLYRQLRDKKSLDPDSILLCYALNNNIDTYILGNVYYDKINNITPILENINKLINYIDIININSICVSFPNIKIYKNDYRNKFYIYSEIYKIFKKNKKIKKINFFIEDNKDIKIIKFISFVSKVPFLKQYI